MESHVVLRYEMKEKTYYIRHYEWNNNDIQYLNNHSFEDRKANNFYLNPNSVKL